MALPAGTKFGVYELSGPLGAGGMGEVYRARDPRLKRDVAIKIVPAAFCSDSQRLRRFEQEARATAALSHPNILAVHDVGTENGTPYIVSELLEGETLRTRLSAGPIPIRKAVEYAVQIARGLSAAHDQGIVHRDLKPENIFLTRDGRVKMLDFGLAKLTHPDPGSGDSKTHILQSDPGSVVGTAGYISPEQVWGKPADSRSDLFAFGAVLYEMVSGQRAFQGETLTDTMSAILHQEPPALTETNAQVPAALQHIVRHCLEKNPAERFQSARDVAFDLETLGSVSSTAAVRAVGPLVDRSLMKVLMAAAVIALAVLAGILIGRKTLGPAVLPFYQQVTFRRGTVTTGKFAPGGQVAYAAAWENNPLEVFTAVSGGRGSTTTGIRGADVESVSLGGELLLVMNRAYVAGYARPGTLARAPLSGAAPRPMMEDVQDADWSPDGTAIAVAHYVGQRFRLEYPIGTVLYETDGWISYPRVSPKGDMVAFLDHPFFGDDAGRVVVVDLAGHRRMASPNYESTQALAWTRSGEELWFSAASTGVACDIYGVNLAGKVRTVARAPGGLRLLDIGQNGSVIAAQGHARRPAMTLGARQTAEQDLAVADWSVPIQLSNDGKMLLLEEQAEGNQDGSYSVYLRTTDGLPPVKLGDGNALGLSPDGKWALAGTQNSPRHLVVLPIGAGEMKLLTHDPVQLWAAPRRAAEFLDNRQIAFSGNEPGHGPRVWIQAIDGGRPRAITAEGISGSLAVSPDGKQIAISGDQVWIVSAQGGEARTVPGTSRGEFAIGWSQDTRFLFIYPLRGIPTKLFRVDVSTGRRELIKQFAPGDTAGVEDVGPVVVTPDAHYYSYGFVRNLTDMYSIQGLK